MGRNTRARQVVQKNVGEEADHPTQERQCDARCAALFKSCAFGQFGEYYGKVLKSLEVDRMACEKDFYVRRDHADRTARITRRRCASSASASASAPARTTASPITISMAELIAITDPVGLSVSADSSGALLVKISPPPIKLRASYADPSCDRRDVHSKSACLLHSPELKIVGPETAQLPGRPFKSIRHGLNRMDHSRASRRRRHRSSQPEKSDA
jgi:hypothetical protein